MLYKKNKFKLYLIIILIILTIKMSESSITYGNQGSIRRYCYDNFLVLLDTARFIEMEYAKNPSVFVEKERRYRFIDKILGELRSEKRSLHNYLDYLRRIDSMDFSYRKKNAILYHIRSLTNSIFMMENIRRAIKYD